MRLGVPIIPRRGRRREPVLPVSVVYRERLWVPSWWYPVALAVAAVLAAEFRVAGLSLTVWIPFGVLLPVAAGVVAALGRSRVEVSGGEIRVRGAHLPLEFVSGVIALDAATMRLVVGREGDPAAFVSIRSWVGPGVQLWLDDPDDPTPYWLLSTRRPHELVDILRQQLRFQPSSAKGSEVAERSEDRPACDDYGRDDRSQDDRVGPAVVPSLPHVAAETSDDPTHCGAHPRIDRGDDAEAGEQDKREEA